MLRDFAIVFGAAVLGTGICSPAAGSINAHSSTLVFLGLAIIVSVVWADYHTDKKHAE